MDTSGRSGRGVRLMQVQAMFSAREARPIAAPARIEPEEIKLIGQARRFSRDQEIYGEGESADFVYKVISGTVRAFRVLADGRRQIAEFYLPGDVFGVEAGIVRRTTAEAVSEAQVIVARRSSLVAEDGAKLWRIAVHDLERSQE